MRLLHAREILQGLVHLAHAHQVRDLVELTVGALVGARSGRKQDEQEHPGEDGREQSWSHRGQKVGLCRQNRSDGGRCP